MLLALDVAAVADDITGKSVIKLLLLLLSLLFVVFKILN